MKDLITVKQGKATIARDHSGKCLTEKQQILNWWTGYCSELYNYKANGAQSVLDCPKTYTEDDHPILRKVEAAVQSLKKGKSGGVDNIPAELVQAGGEDVITALTTICNKTWQTGEWPTPWTESLVIAFQKKRQPAAVPELPNDQPHQLPKQSHAEDHTEQIEATSKEDHRWRTGRLQSRKTSETLDRVWHTALWATMKQCNISTNLIQVIKNPCDKVTSAVLFNSSIGDWFRTTAGVR